MVKCTNIVREERGTIELVYLVNAYFEDENCREIRE